MTNAAQRDGSTSFGKRWTPHEIQIIADLREQGVDFETIATQIGRDPKSCADRLSAWRRTQGLARSTQRWTDDADHQLLELCATRPDRKRWKEIAGIMGRSISSCYSRHTYLTNATKQKAARNSHGPSFPAMQADPEALAKRMLYVQAKLRQCPAAALLGDPPPGYSALDQRGQGCSGLSSTSSMLRGSQSQ